MFDSDQRTATRVVALWAPDWPVTAACAVHGIDDAQPVALVDHGLVHAVDARGRAAGVRRGLRVREAQARCPELVVLDHDPHLDARQFEPVIAGLEALVPHVQVLRPGLVAVAARGAARYYGGEREAAIVLAERLVELGTRDAAAGVADGLFAAEQAARRSGDDRIRLVAAGDSAAFLAPLPIALIGELAGPQTRGDELVALLKRLGITTLGGFAALPEADVLTRFGPDGARLHAVARAADVAPHLPRVPPPDLDLAADFEPPIDRIDQLAFAVRERAGAFVAAMTARRLVLTSITVELIDDRGGTSLRTWSHPRSFSDADVVDRVRWQLEAARESTDADDVRAPVVRLRVTPEAVDAIGNHEAGLFGPGADERVHHALSRVQSLLGRDGVLVPSIGGGRTLAERTRLVAWGETDPGALPADRPWPGRLPDPLPGTVFASPHPVFVADDGGVDVTIDERGSLSGAPRRFTWGTTTRRIIGWAGPWPLEERWWADAGAGRTPPPASHRFQLIDDAHCAWLLVLREGSWWLEARYD